MSAGKINAPTATIVTPEAPVKAVKKAQTKKETIASPAGIHPITKDVNLTSLDERPLSANTYPEKVKRGSAKSIGVSIKRYNSIAITVSGTSAK